MSNAQKIAIVTGDVTMDWNLARTQRARYGAAGWTRDDCTRACWLSCSVPEWVLA
jgi:hypothetical protein